MVRGDEAASESSAEAHSMTNAKLYGRKLPSGKILKGSTGTKAWATVFGAFRGGRVVRVSQEGRKP